MTTWNPARPPARRMWKLDRSRRQPRIVFPHGGVHANFTTYHANILEELLAQGYTVIAPEYRAARG